MISRARSGSLDSPSHDLHEPGRAWVAFFFDVDLGALGERRVAVEQRCRLRPPRVLLGPLLVLRAESGLESHHGDGAAVGGDAGCRAKPAGRTGATLARHLST